MSEPKTAELRELLWEWVVWEERGGAVPTCVYLNDPSGYGSDVCWTGPIYTNEMLLKRANKLKKELLTLEQQARD